MAVLSARPGSQAPARAVQRGVTPTGGGCRRLVLRRSLYRSHGLRAAAQPYRHLPPPPLRQQAALSLSAHPRTGPGARPPRPARAQHPSPARQRQPAPSGSLAPSAAPAGNRPAAHRRRASWCVPPPRPPARLGIGAMPTRAGPSEMGVDRVQPRECRCTKSNAQQGGRGLLR